MFERLLFDWSRKQHRRNYTPQTLFRDIGRILIKKVKVFVFFQVSIIEISNKKSLYLLALNVHLHILFNMLLGKLVIFHIQQQSNLPHYKIVSPQFADINDLRTFHTL